MTSAPDLPPVRLEQIVLEESSSSASRREGTPQFSIDQKREMSKIWISGILGLFLWLILGGLIVAHFWAISRLSWRMIDHGSAEKQAVPPSSQTLPQTPQSSQDRFSQDVERYEKAVVTINDTAKSLYTLLAPLATAITGYYFTSKSGNTKDDSDFSS